jgi:hypothetical protein
MRRNISVQTEWLLRGGKLGSLAALGAGAISLASGKAEAADIITSGILNSTIGFTSNSVIASGRNHASLKNFNTFVGGPRLTFSATSVRTGGGFQRVVKEGYGAVFQVVGGLVAVFSSMAEWKTPVQRSSTSSLSSPRNGDAVAVRSAANGNANARGSSFTDKYFLFRFAGTSFMEYGWIEASLSVTAATNSLAINGPNLTIIQYAFDDTGAFIKAGVRPATRARLPPNLLR